jgi:hypothetical protein
MLWSLKYFLIRRKENDISASSCNDKIRDTGENENIWEMASFATNDLRLNPQWHCLSVLYSAQHELGTRP